MIRFLSQRYIVPLLAAGQLFSFAAVSAAQGQDTKPTRRILALGGGGFRGSDSALPRYYLSLTGKKNPLVYYLPTANADSDQAIVEWYETMNELDCRPRHLKLLALESYRTKNLEATLLAADAIYVGGGNTLNMLAVWKAQGIDKILRKAYDKGIVLGGESAGMICWFEQGNTGSRPEKLTAMECLGFLKGSACPHYSYWGGDRKSTLCKMILDGEMKDGIACSDYAALLYEDDKLARVFAIAGGGGKAFHIRQENGKIVEKEIPSEKIPATPSKVVNIWPGKPADDDAGKIGDEKFFELMVKGKPYQVDGKSTKWLTNVTTPTLSIYPVPSVDIFGQRMKGDRPAVLIAPGGGYHNLGWDVEGTEIADWLNSIGITGIILKYRCPRRPGDVKGVPPIGPLKDAQRAVSLVRANAKEWGIDPNRIGMVGFSAGGHLVGAACTNFDKRAYAPIDDIDKVSCRPDFGIMCYSGYFKVGDGLSQTVKTPKDAPPLFFVHATDDAISDADHSIAFYQALKQAKVDAQLHVYANGGHGFGVRRGSPCYGWTRTCQEWMRDHGFLKMK